jgi:hypothetical protein
MKQPLVVSDFTTRTDGSTNRVSATVDGGEIWFESDDAQLTAAPEAFGGIMLIPALENGRDLVIRGTVSKLWLENLFKVADKFRQWWGYPEISIEADAAEPIPAPEDGRTGVLFSCGVDAFYSLLETGFQYDDLIGINGMGFETSSPLKYKAHRESGWAVARASGASYVQLRTNGGKHPLLLNIIPKYTVGGFLTGAGHLLGRTNRLVISSSFTEQSETLWSTSPMTDPLWVREGMEIIHFGGNATRMDKISAIVDNPLVREYLNVCIPNRQDFTNCGLCEKCVRTRLTIAAEGKLADYTAFPTEPGLVASVDRLYAIPPYMIEDYEAIIEKGVPEDVHQAVLRLFERTRKRSRPLRSRIRNIDRKIRQDLVNPLLRSIGLRKKDQA